MKKLKSKKPSSFYQSLINIFYVDILPIPGYCSLKCPSLNFFLHSLRSSYYQVRPHFIRTVKHVSNLIVLSTS